MNVYVSLPETPSVHDTAVPRVDIRIPVDVNAERAVVEVAAPNPMRSSVRTNRRPATEVARSQLRVQAARRYL